MSVFDDDVSKLVLHDSAIGVHLAVAELQRVGVGDGRGGAQNLLKLQLVTLHVLYFRFSPAASLLRGVPGVPFPDLSAHALLPAQQGTGLQCAPSPLPLSCSL